MKNLLTVLFLVVFAFSVTAFADQQPKPVGTNPAVCAQLKKDGASNETRARRGCCSWHSGVCGCSGTRVVCCDGTYSPTCTCNKKGSAQPDPHS